MNYILHLNKTFIRLILYPNPVTNMTLIISFITFFVIDVIGEYFKFPKLRLGTWTHGHLSFWNGRRKLTFNGQRKQDIFHQNIFCRYNPSFLLSLGGYFCLERRNERGVSITQTFRSERNISITPRRFENFTDVALQVYWSLYLPPISMTPEDNMKDTIVRVFLNPIHLSLQFLKYRIYNSSQKTTPTTLDPFCPVFNVLGKLLIPFIY